MPTAAEMAATFAELARGPVTVGQARAIVDSGLALLDTLESEAGDLQIPAWVHVQAAIERARQRLSYAAGKLAGRDDREIIAPGSELWREVVGPVIAGICYGPPYCEETTVAGFGGAAPIAPVGAEPYAVGSAIAAGREAADFAWRELLRDVQKSGSRVASGIAWAAQTALAAAIGFFIWEIMRDD